MKAVSGLLLLAAALVSSSLVGCVGEDPSSDPSTNSATEQLQDGQLEAAQLSGPNVGQDQKTSVAPVVNGGRVTPQVVTPSLEAPAADSAPGAAPGGDPGTPDPGAADPGTGNGKTGGGATQRGGSQMDPEPCPWSQKSGTNT